MLTDKSQQVRKNTALALMKMGAINSIEEIQNALKVEPNDQVKAVMFVAINQLERIMD